MNAEGGGSIEDAVVPEVTVVIPTRDRRELLLQTLRSVLWQRDVDFECIVVDDGSSDDTASAVEGLGDPRIRLVRHETSHGVSAARNRGIDEARGEWIAFLDDDDLWAPDKLRLQLEAARRSRCAWVYVGHVNVTRGLNIVGGNPPPDSDEVVERLPEENIVPGGTSGVMASRRALIDAGCFDPSLQPMADWDLWLRLVATGRPACVPLPLVGYRVHTQNMSLDTARVESDFAVVARRSGRASYAVLYRYLGWWCRRAGRRRKALSYFLRGALQRDRRYPLRVFSADLRYLALDSADALRLRLAPRLAPRLLPFSLLPSGTEEHAEWRAAPLPWIDDLSGGA
jgi:glycosyltransferase involved in cell wall biosynthesis